MTANRKLYAYGEIRLITFRAQEHLPLPSNWYINRLLEGIMAKAQNDYRVEIIGFVFMSNHLHIMVRVLYPPDTTKFLQYIKRESSHYVNRLLGRRQRSIWNKGSDDPVILDIDDAIKRLAYLYTNPSAAHLEDTIEKYPGLNSWKALISGQSEYELFSNYRISRDAVPSLRGNTSLRKHKQLDLISYMEKSTLNKQRNTLVISPYAILKTFADSDMTEEEIRGKIVTEVQENEKKLREQRAKKEWDCVGTSELRLAELNKEHVPKKYGKKMLCLSSCIELRKIYIKAYRAIQCAAEEAYILWNELGVIPEYPEGTYAPGGRMSAAPWCHNAIYIS